MSEQNVKILCVENINNFVVLNKDFILYSLLKDEYLPGSKNVLCFGKKLAFYINTS